MKRIPLTWSTLFADGGTGAKRFFPATPWLPAAQVKVVKGIWEAAQIQSNGSVQLSYQTCNVENSIDAPVLLDSAQTSAGVSYGTVTDVSANTGSKALVRFGFTTWYTAGAVNVFSRAGGSVDYDSV